MREVTVYKRDHRGKPVTNYSGQVVASSATRVCIEARYEHNDKDVGVVVFCKGDLLTEWHYSDRYYNVFKIQDGVDGRLKGWYCNITRPAEITDSTIKADDLALDVFVSPTGEITVLDEDEFAALDLSPDEQAAALAAVEAIRRLVAEAAEPFNR
jgi:predicted RNA-binding protein associated with RNAse of E/G family